MVRGAHCPREAAPNFGLEAFSVGSHAWGLRCETVERDDGVSARHRRARARTGIGTPVGRARRWVGSYVDGGKSFATHGGDLAGSSVPMTRM